MVSQGLAVNRQTGPRNAQKHMKAGKARLPDCGGAGALAKAGTYGIIREHGYCGNTRNESAGCKDAARTPAWTDRHSAPAAWRRDADNALQRHPYLLHVLCHRRHLPRPPRPRGENRPQHSPMAPVRVGRMARNEGAGDASGSRWLVVTAGKIWYNAHP